MSECKFCGAEIDWDQNEFGDWVPIDIETGERHNCYVPTCKFCNKEIEWAHREGKWIPFDPSTKKRHQCQMKLGARR